MSNQDLSLEGFVSKIMEEKGVSALTEEAQKDIERDLLERLEDRMNAAMLENVKPEKLEDFENILDNENEERVQEFLRDPVNIKEADIELLVANELMSFRDTYLSI